MTLRFQYDPDRTLEAILYIANNISHPTKISVLKLLYFSDKTSLEIYGRFITGDQYYAMQYGPVATHAYEMMMDHSNQEEYGFTIGPDSKSIRPQRQADLDKLSASDLMCLNEVLHIYNYPAWILSNMTHRDPAWEKNWARRTHEHGRVEIPLEDIIMTLKNSDELLEDLLETTKKAD